MADSDPLDRSLARATSVSLEKTSSQLVQRALQDAEALQVTQRPYWRFAQQLLCGAVIFQGDESVIVGGHDRSPTHALGHLGLRSLCGRSASQRKRSVSVLVLKTIEAWAGVTDGVWTVDQEEQVVRQYESYVAEVNPLLAFESRSPKEVLSPVLREVFKEIWPLDGPEFRRFAGALQPSVASPPAVAITTPGMTNMKAAGLDPETLGDMMDLVESYIREGVLRFKDMVARFHEEWGARAPELDPYLEVLWEDIQGERVSVAEALSQPSTNASSTPPPPLTARENHLQRRKANRFAQIKKAVEGHHRGDQIVPASVERHEDPSPERQPMTASEAALEIMSKTPSRILALADRFDDNGFVEVAKALRSELASYDPKPWYDSLEYWANLIRFYGFRVAEEQAMYANNGLEPPTTILF